MTKAELSSALAEQAGITKVRAGQLVEMTLGIVATQLSRGEVVDLHGFGKFSVTEKAERPGVNPATGAPLTIAASKNVKFKANVALKRQL